MVDVVTFGESMARLTSAGTRPLRFASQLALGVAGAESNVAIGLARLGRSVQWTGRVGDDEFGRLVTSSLRGEGVTTRALVDDGAPTGLLVKAKRSATITDINYYRAGSAGSRLTPDDLDLDAIASAGVLHLTGITAAISESARETCFAAVEAAERAGVRVSLDVNMRRRLWSETAATAVLEPLARRATIVFATEDEARMLVGGDGPADAAERLAGLGVEQVIVKQGSRGAMALVDGEIVESAPQRVVEVDPVGAGDAFCAGYLHELLAGSSVPRRLEIAGACGAFAVTVEGDWEGLPTQRDLDALGGLDVRR